MSKKNRCFAYIDGECKALATYKLGSVARFCGGFGCPFFKPLGLENDHMRTSTGIKKLSKEVLEKPRLTAREILEND